MTWGWTIKGAIKIAPVSVPRFVSNCGSTSTQRYSLSVLAVLERDVYNACREVLTMGWVWDDGSVLCERNDGRTETRFGRMERPWLGYGVSLRGVGFCC